MNKQVNVCVCITGETERVGGYVTYRPIMGDVTEILFLLIYQVNLENVLKCGLC